MVNLAIGGHGFTQASAALHLGNQVAARHHRELSRALSGTGAMAGDSSFAEHFAPAYDTAATEALSTLGEAVGAFAGLGRLAMVSLENHTRAEIRSRLEPLFITNFPTPSSDDWYSVITDAPPSSLGGDPSSLPGWANWILDHVEGFIWPDADIDRLRAAAVAWRSAASGATDLVGIAAQAETQLWDERSPEIPLAAHAVTQLGDTCRSLADQMTGIADSCDGYADEVEAQREAILDLVKDLIRDGAIIQAGGFALGLVTGGLGNGGAVAVNLGRITAKAPRFKAMLDAVRAAALTAAIRLDQVGTEVAVLRTRIAKFSAASPRIAVVRGVSVPRLQLPGFLRLHEVKGSHTISRHVGKTDAELIARIDAGDVRRYASTFPSLRAAEKGVEAALLANAREIRHWLKYGRRPLPINGPALKNIGKCLRKEDGVVKRYEPTRVRVVLKHDASRESGFRVHTAYPDRG